MASLIGTGLLCKLEGVDGGTHDNIRCPGCFKSIKGLPLKKKIVTTFNGCTKYPAADTRLCERENENTHHAGLIQQARLTSSAWQILVQLSTERKRDER